MNVTTLEQEAARFAAANTVQAGLRTLEFYAAAFSETPDANGDVIDPTAFDGWLKDFYAAGNPLPISFSHASMLDSLDPTNVIGYAPADPDHVRVDDYGLRITGFIDTASEKGKAVEWQIENHLIGGASIAYVVPPGGRVKGKAAGSFRIMEARVKEAGPTPNPANQEAVLLWLKGQGLTEVPAEVPYMTVEEFRATFKDGAGAEAEAEVAEAQTTTSEGETPEIESKHGAAPRALQSAHDALVSAGAKCAMGEPQVKETDDTVKGALRRLRLMKAGLAR